MQLLIPNKRELKQKNCLKTRKKKNKNKHKTLTFIFIFISIFEEISSQRIIQSELFKKKNKVKYYLKKFEQITNHLTYKLSLKKKKL